MHCLGRTRRGGILSYFALTLMCYFPTINEIFWILSDRRNRCKSSFVTMSSSDGKKEVTQTIGTTGPIPWANRRYYPINQPDWVKAREYFGDEGPFVMDAKQVGNLGRYFNHSCQPNIFAQSVFASNHDPRFPDVAFFALR